MTTHTSHGRQLLSTFGKLLIIAVVWCYVTMGISEGKARGRCQREGKSYTRTITLPIPNCPRFVFRHASSPNAPLRALSAMSLERKTANQIRKTFPGIFYKREEVEKLNISPKSRGYKRGRNTNYDGDLHCQTNRYFEQAPNRTMNVGNEMRTIVHMYEEQVYQFYHKGTCVKPGQQSGSRCSGGSCFQEKSVVYLLVYDDDNPSWPVTFDAFEVDSYCSCRGIF